MSSPDLPEPDFSEEVPDRSEPGDDTTAGDDVEAAPDA